MWATFGGTVLVDPEILRAFAAQVDSAATAINAIDLGVIAPAAADGVQGSDTQWAAREIGRHLGLAVRDVVKDVDAMGQAVRGAGEQYEVEDSALAGTFDKLF